MVHLELAEGALRDVAVSLQNWKRYRYNNFEHVQNNDGKLLLLNLVEDADHLHCCVLVVCDTLGLSD